MADPVSWLLIEPGWKVCDSSGEEVGRIVEVVGDTSADIFDGLAIAAHMTAHPLYVPAEQVAGIVEGTVTLALDRQAVDALEEYSEPAEVAEISSEKAGVFRRLESDLAPPSQHTERLGLVRRVLLWFGLVGKR